MFFLPGRGHDVRAAVFSGARCAGLVTAGKQEVGRHFRITRASISPVILPGDMRDPCPWGLVIQGMERKERRSEMKFCFSPRGVFRTPAVSGSRPRGDPDLIAAWSRGTYPVIPSALLPAGNGFNRPGSCGHRHGSRGCGGECQPKRRHRRGAYWWSRTGAGRFAHVGERVR